MAEGVLPENCPDSDVERQCFQKDKIIDYTCLYLIAVGSEESTNKGRVEDRFKIGQLRQRAEALWWFIIWFLLEDAGSIYPAWKLKSEAAMYKVAVESSLGVGRYPKEYFGPAELWLLFQAMVGSPESASWMKQHYALWALVTVTGARPGSLTLIHGYRGQPQYLKWKDIRFFRIADKPGLFLEIKLLWLKGQRDPHHARASTFKAATFVVFPCQNRANICADVTWILPKLAIERGLFGNMTLDQLQTSDRFELPQDPTVADQPVFIAGREGKSGISDKEIKPLSSSAVNPVLQKVARRAGLSVRSTVYCFRREFITSIGRNAGVDQAKELASHAPERSSYGRYDYGIGDINVTEIRFAESRFASSGEARNELRSILNSPAISKLNTPFDENSCKAYVVFAAKMDQSVADFDESLRVISHTLCEKFNITSPKSSFIIETLEKISSEPSGSTGSIVPKEMELPEEWLSLTPKIETSQQAYYFFKEFLKARKNNRAFVYSKIRREYIKEWELSLEKPSLQQITQRQELSKNPIVLQDIAASRELQNRESLPLHVEAFKTAKKSMRTKVTTNDSSDEEEVEPDEHWDGRQIDTADLDANDPEDQEDDSIDLFDELQDGARVQVAVADDDDDDNATTSNMDPATEYAKARATVMRLWDDFTDIPRGKMVCPLCLADPLELKEISLDSGFKFDRHVCAPTGPHNPRAGKGALIEGYAQWCELSGRFVCRLCNQAHAKEKSYVDYKKLSKHLKKDHVDFCKRLCE